MAPQAFTAVDLDDDGLSDFVTASEDGTLHVYLASAEGLRETRQLNGYRARSVDAVDLDRDGRAELLVTSDSDLVTLVEGDLAAGALSDSSVGEGLPALGNFGAGASDDLALSGPQGVQTSPNAAAAPVALSFNLVVSDPSAAIANDWVTVTVKPHTYSDVLPTNALYSPVELATEQIVAAGCTATKFCPTLKLKRGQGVAAVVKAF